MPSPPDLLLTAEEAPMYGMSSAYIEAFELENAGVFDAKLAAVTSEALGYIKSGGAITLPLEAWGNATRQKVADLLVYELRSYLGLAPAGLANGDENVILRAEAARNWLRGLGAGDEEDPELEHSGSDDSPTATIAIVSDDPRGW